MDLKVFTNDEFGSVRSVTINNEPYFVGKDVADILGYQNGSRDINRHVDEEDRYKIMVFDGNQDKETIVINESGLYSLILSSKLPNAKRFKRWVTAEVLPSIRKHGLYAVDELLNNPDVAIAVLTELKNEREKTRKLESTVAVQSQQIAELEPKATYYDIVLSCKDAVPISVIAKDYGWSAQQMNEHLSQKKVQYKRSDIWLLYQNHARCGYTKTTTHVYDDRCGYSHAKLHTKWTQKSRLFIYDLLKKDGIYPQIEKAA
jgi:anti-repressor protein